jgi:sulfur relay (sulfurtransferase) complex TusBCD TusD component (DsrE family)
MKVRESGMPEAEYWDTLFDVPLILDAMRIDSGVRHLVEFGCGFGTFTVPAAQRIRGVCHGLDIDPAMIEATWRRAQRARADNVALHLRDFVEVGTGLDADSVDYVMLFNILHAESPLGLLQEAYRILLPCGRVGVIHWNHDPATPRGPPMSMRPRPEDCVNWLAAAGFSIEGCVVDLPPYHYGLIGRKPTSIHNPSGELTHEESRDHSMPADRGPLSGKLLEAGQEVRVFLMNDAVDMARDLCKPPEGYDQDLSQMLRDLISKGVEVKVCGTCMARCGIYKNQPYFKGAEQSAMAALADWVIDSAKVITF